MDEFLQQEFVCFEGKVYHIGWVRSWQIQCVDSYIRFGRLFKAERITDGSADR